MSNVARNRYLEGRIRGAGGPRLRSMLVDRAWQACRSTKAALEEGRLEDLSDDSEKLRTILRELFATIDAESSEVASRVRGLYEYLHRVASVAILRRDATSLTHVEEILQFESETWRQVAAQIETGEESAVAPMTARSAFSASA